MSVKKKMEWQKLTPESIEILKKEELFLVFSDADIYNKFCIYDWNERTESFLLMAEGWSWYSEKALLSVYSHYCLLEKPKE